MMRGKKRKSDYEDLKMAEKKRPSTFNPGVKKKVRAIEQFLEKEEDPNYW